MPAGIIPPLKLTVLGRVVETVPPTQVVASVPVTTVKFVFGVAGKVSTKGETVETV